MLSSIKTVSGISSMKCLFNLTPVCTTFNAMADVKFVRYNHKHWDPRFKKQRRLKMLRVELPDFDKIRQEKKLSPEEIKIKMKERGIVPPRVWIERPINISCTGGLFEPYVPPEGDGKLSLVSLPGAKQKIEEFEKKGKSMLALRKLRNFEEEFNAKLFADQAQEIYIEAHKALAAKEEDKLHDLVTEYCYPDMTLELANKTMRWNFIQSLEPSRVVHARCTDMLSKENVYAQLTVRIHTRQTLAIYDRFGRLMFGNDVVAKDVLEYIVFEKHLSNQYGQWRIHGKIVPEWLQPQDTFYKTFVKQQREEIST